MDIKDILTTAECNNIAQFKKEDKDWINGQIHARKDGSAGIECVVRGMNSDGDYFKLTPEEIIRQYYAYKLINEYNYDKEQLSFEEPVIFAGKSIINDRRIDIAVFDKEHKKIDMIIEVKRPSINDYNATSEGEATTPFQQLQSYCNQKHPQVGVLVNGNKAPEFYDAPDYENQLIIDRFPQSDEDIQEWKENRRFTLKQLIQSDRLQTETLKDIILEVEQRFGANDSSDKAFEEIFKLIFTKLYDEKMSSDDADAIAIGMNTYKVALKDIDDSQFRVMEFRSTENDSPEDIYTKINKLFKKAQNKWKGVFPADSVLNMQKATIKSCVKELQNVKLFNSNLEVVDDAFEHLVNQNQKEGMGQYFTPRYVIDMCVKMLNPKPEEKMIDTAAGSCGFPMHSIFHVWKQINPAAYNLFTTKKRKPEETEYVQNNVFGIDFSEKSVRVGRMLNIIAGDGHTNVIELNSLDYKNWDSDYVKNTEWYAKYGEGFQKLVDMSSDKSAPNASKKYKGFNFDVLMANPPFAGDLDNKEQIEQYDLGHKGGDVTNKRQNKVGRDILFIERNLNFLKPGGRMAVVLPQGRFNNSTDKYIRDYIIDRCRLLAVVGLHGNAFKPHTGTKTSVLLVQKWTDENCGYPNICPRPEADENGEIDYPIFFATMQEPSKDNSGDKIYVTENYVKWCNYKYRTVKIITRKEDGALIEQDEYDLISDKDNYDKIVRETVYTKNRDRYSRRRT
ncbi:TPA: N-6 DNA methylase [Clostridium botulinum]|nr:N-6 DNA methylase [Clostridium botulinum]